MAGQRERVAKALVLECIRGAKQQSRKCYLIAFSGRNEVKELELSASAKAEAMAPLLDFLQGGFEGGTDINEPIARSIDLLNQKDQVSRQEPAGSWGRPPPSLSIILSTIH